MRTGIYAGAAVAAVVLGVGAGLWLTRGSGDDQFAQCRDGAVAGGDIGGPFTLTSGGGETVTDQDLLQKPALIYFGYTFCPDVCPLDAVRNADAAAILNDSGNYDVTPVFITIDPKRDTPDAVADFTGNIYDRMVGLTGTEEQVAAAADAYKVYYKAHDTEDDEFYLIDHSVFSYFMLPDEGFVEFFRRDVTAEEIADKMACFIDNA